MTDLAEAVERLEGNLRDALPSLIVLVECADLRTVLDALSAARGGEPDTSELHACARYVTEARNAIEGADRGRELARMVLALPAPPSTAPTQENSHD